MPLITKPNYNQVFASNAPDIDKPAEFNNYPSGWAESRQNNGKPTIKQFNFLQQTSDLKTLWILQNGAALPYDASIEYAEGALSLKEGVLQQFVSGSWVEFKKDTPYFLKYYQSGVSYPLNARIMLSNGDIVRSTVANNTIDPNLDMTGWVTSLPSSVTPFDFGYKGGDDDYGYYLQLAIDSGKNVIGANGVTKVRMSTIASISKSGQSVDLSMIEELEWLGNYPLYGDSTTLNKAIGVINIKPSIVQNSNLTLNFSESIIVNTLPAQDSNIIELGAHNYAVGDLLIFQMTYPTGNYNAYKVGTVTKVTETTVSTDYFFAYVPTTLTVHKAIEVCEGITLKMPQKIIDNSGATLVGNLVSGVGVVYARNCEIQGAELINGTNHAISYARSTRCKDYSFSCTLPRMVGGGQGYTVSVVGSTHILSHDPVNTHGRHVTDWTSSAYCKSYRARAYNMQQVPIITHGQYEHDCDYIDAGIDDCSHLTGVSGRAVNIGSSGAEFGERAKRINGVGGVLRGAIYVNPNAESCNLKNGIEFNSAEKCNLSPNGGLEINAKFTGGSSLDIQGVSGGLGNVSINSIKITGTIDLRAGIQDVSISGGSSFSTLATTTTAKPRSIKIGGGSTWNPSSSPVLEAVSEIVLSNGVSVRGASTVSLILKAKSVRVDQSVNFYGSVGCVSQASESFLFSGSFTEPAAGRSNALLQQAVSGANVQVSSANIRTFSTTSPSINVGASVSPNSVVVNGSYIEGVTNLSTNANITKCIVANNIVKDDSTLRSAVSSGSKIFQSNVY